MEKPCQRAIQDLSRYIFANEWSAFFRDINDDTHDCLSVFPCDEDDVMAFRVPTKLLVDHKCVMRINSKQFIQGLMRANQLDPTKTYTLSGEYLSDANTAVFSLVTGITLRGSKPSASA